MTMPLVKLPLLLVEAYCAHISVKSPTPRSPDHEIAQYANNNKTKDIVQWPNIKGPFLYRVRCLYTLVCAPIFTLPQYNFYCIALIEALFILVSILSPSTYLPRIFQPGTALDVRTLHSTPIYTLGLLFMCAGSVVRASCYRHMGRFFTFELSLKQGHQLVTSGPYAIVRHPSYVGSCLFYSGACLSQLGSGSWLAASGLWGSYVGSVLGAAYVGYSMFICVFLLARVPKEDMMMKKEFQDKWVEYAKHTPYRLIPYVY